MIRALGFWLGLILVLATVNYQIMAKQEILDTGQEVLLRLRPADPRSLMQGDYMRLRYEQELLPKSLEPKEVPRNGSIVVSLDEHGVGRFQRLDDGRPRGKNEQRLGYRLRYRPDLDRSSQPAEFYFGAKSFFFQEGHGSLYDDARYGILRVAEDGSSVLHGLADADYRRIIPPKGKSTADVNISR
ncbi:MAG: GDYXXLXY domain-containing protein [Gammaproteobacteria bacterium]|nr:GDYXXLXY domain-containing protein [Gammaproteobacteria bacterium]